MTRTEIAVAVALVVTMVLGLAIVFLGGEMEPVLNTRSVPDYPSISAPNPSDLCVRLP